MATKKVNQTSWLDQDVNDGVREKLPTLRQYLKELKGNVTDIKSTVRIVWLPGKWKNYTFQTDHFRVTVSDSHPLFAGIRANFDAFSKGTQTLDVIVTDRKSVSYRLSVNPEEVGEWFFIAGDAGLKFTRNDESGDNCPW